MFIVAFRIYYQNIFDKGLLLTRKLAFGPSGKVEVVLRKCAENHVRLSKMKPTENPG
jgi:hypothetical protein